MWKKYRAKPGEKIPLGRSGEHLARTIVFDISSWEQNYGEGVVGLLHQRRGDTAPYPVDIEQDGNIVRWRITEADNAVSGTGRAELQYVVGDVVVKSDMYYTVTKPSIGESTGEIPPEPQQAWVDNVIQTTLGAQAAAESAKAGALSAKAAAGTAMQRAEDAQEAAENAADDSASARDEAKRHQSDAEDARSAAVNAQKAAEEAAESVSESAKLISDLAERWYDSYATETKSGFAVCTDIGADRIPPKKMLVYRTNSGGPAYSSITIRQLGKNLFDSSEGAFEIGCVIKDDGSIDTNTNYAYSKAYTPVLPNTDYVFSGRVVGKKTANTVAFYDENGVFIRRYTPKKADGSTAFNTPSQFTTPPDCHFIRYNTSYNVFECDDVQLEVGKTATAFESYAPEDYVIDLKDKSGYSFHARYKSLDLLSGTGISFSGTAIRFTPPPVKTKRGTNCFYVVTGTEEEEKVRYAANISATLRLDPTLAYEKLKAAVIAAGTT